MYDTHPQHHLVCLKSHHFLCPNSFNIHNIFRNTDLTTVNTTKNEKKHADLHTKIPLNNLAIQDKLYKLLLTDPVNPINHDQARKNPP